MTERRSIQANHERAKKARERLKRAKQSKKVVEDAKNAPLSRKRSGTLYNNRF